MFGYIVYNVYFYIMKIAVEDILNLLNISKLELIKLVAKEAIPFRFASGQKYLERTTEDVADIGNIERYKIDLHFAISLLERTGQNTAALLLLARDFFTPFLIDWQGQYHPATVNLYLLFYGSELVYFGQTINGLDRRGQHEKAGKIFDKMLFIPVPDCIDALQLEGRLIRAKQTKYNKCSIARAAWGLQD